MSQNDSISVSVKKKLNPSRFPNMSDVFASIVGYVLGEHFTNVKYAAMIISSDNFLLGQKSEDIGFNDFIGSESDLNKNWKNLLNVAGLTEEELAYANQRFANAFIRA